MQVIDTIASRNEQLEDASSITVASLVQFRVLDTPAQISKHSLFRKREIIIGKVINAIIIIPITPHELFTRERLEETVFSASDTAPPITGIKLPAANRAVLRDNESLLCAKTL